MNLGYGQVLPQMMNKDDIQSVYDSIISKFKLLDF